MLKQPMHNKNMDTKNLIFNIVTEAALDSRISDGIVDLRKIDHLQVVAEKLYETVLSEEIVDEFVKNFLQEGKYPDRQAYNREGWLVTFPSKEYRDAAIKKGTHAISDPTHGQGGMNLYYKRRGKQKRQTQQASTAVSSPPTDSQQAAPAQRAARPTAPATQATTEPTQDATDVDTPFAAEPSDTPEPAQKPEPVDTTDTSSSGTSDDKPVFGSDDSSEEPAPEPKPSEEPAVEVPVAETPPEKYASVSKKFAQRKGWVSEPYGEYRDAEGNTVAVVGLSGEVVPIKSVERDEYKLFAEKSMA